MAKKVGKFHLYGEHINKFCSFTIGNFHLSPSLSLFSLSMYNTILI